MSEGTQQDATAPQAHQAEAVLNVNVGILGHVDSGKTSLARALSSEASTAAFDKSPQSQERGITLDLGFSAFTHRAAAPIPGFPDIAAVQFTLVDCPGHASLLRTIIGGAQIMDTMLLVVDVRKGFQPQTAEGLVVGMLATHKLVVALNKVDMLPAAERAAAIERASQLVRRVLATTPFAGAEVVPVAACPAAGPGACAEAAAGVAALKDALLRTVDESVAERRRRGAAEPFLMAADHCFAVRGQGTVATGTVLRGQVAVGDSVEACETRTVHKVKSIQVFHRPVERASVGDRIGVRLLGLDAKAFERGLVCAPGTVPLAGAVVGRVTRVPYFRQQCCSKTKFHITIGHTTALATVQFFAEPAQTSEEGQKQKQEAASEYECLDELKRADEDAASARAWVLVEFEQPSAVPNGATFVASHLDTDVHTATCRLAFHGRVAASFASVAAAHEALKLYTLRTKEGTIERAMDPRTAIAKGLFKKEANADLYLGLTVTVPGYGAQEGAAADGPVLTAKIDSLFGRSGKFKVVFDRDVTAKGVAGQKIVLRFKKYRFTRHTSLVQ